MKTLLYIYLSFCACHSFYVLVSLWLEDRRGPSHKFGYNFKHSDGRFHIAGQVWFMLFLTLPVVNLIWLYIYIVDFIFKWRPSK